MVQPKALFESGLKIVGVLTIIWGLVHITPVVFQFISIYNQPDMMTNHNLSSYRFSLIFQVVYPVILLMIGIYLLKDGKAVIDMAFNNSSTKGENKISSLFCLFMKMAGLVLIIYSLPKAFQIISNLIFISSVNSVNTFEQTQFIVQNLVMSVINFVFGIYLLRSGKVFYKIGFSKNNGDE
ncbi:hypothetical protein ACFFJI_11740 [Allobacillus sp. GCM10007491]|uniref:Uncharacterized protein n=1 Tax=Allobacillus saliphilus TaxID=2912308 RepID=A0A941HUK0_9BACI|nr:hypothetical protein [Allobacillus saliphilus]MBR7554965.1 hypothetical protein [Allobacillus saliphilus]